MVCFGWTLVAVMNVLASAGARAQATEPSAGVSLELATARARNISHLRYDLALSIPATPASPVTGSTVLRFRLADASKPLVIDFDAEERAGGDHHRQWRRRCPHARSTAIS